MAARESLVDEALRDIFHMTSSRGTWEGHWEEVAQRVFPEQSGTFSPNAETTPGAKNTSQQIDATAAVALGRFAAVVDSLLTPRTQKWHKLTALDETLRKRRDVQLWFDSVATLMFRYRYAPDANFPGSNSGVYTSLGAFGNGPLFVDALAGAPGVRYRAIPLGEIYFGENHQGVIDKAVRKFRMNARQLAQKFPKVELPYQVAQSNDDNVKFVCYHYVSPNIDRDPQRKDFRGARYRSLYILEMGRVLLDQGGYRSWPYPTARDTRAPGEIYGRGPAMRVLPAIKTLDEEKKTILKQGHRTVDPILLAHDDGVVDALSLRPGAIIAGGVSDQGKLLVQPLPVGDIRVGRDMLADERQIINDEFLVSLFQILTQTPTMTATEVLERVREKGILLAPTVGRQQSEYLGRLINRELDVLSRQGLLPAPPPELIEAGGEFTVIYDSPMSRAQRAEEASGLLRSIESVASVVQLTQDPSPFDWYDWDTIVPELSEIQAVPAHWLRGPTDVAARRGERNQKAEMQQMIDAAPALSGALKSVQAAGK